MGESACLLRSFSHPSDASREAKEGDPMRALGESISFGRFMSESLAWEKWSAFSHNRYLEEVEKFSKPGSVAQKKAYFEDHYKKKAEERAAALLEEANTSAMTEVKTEDTSCTSSCSDSELLTANNQVVATGEQRGFVQNAESVSSTDVDSHNSMNEESMVKTTKVEEHIIDQNNYMETSPNNENANPCENAEDDCTIVVAEDEKTPANPPAEREITASGSLKRLMNYSSKLITQSRSSKPPSSPAKQAASIQQPIHRSNVTPKSKKHAGDVAERLTMKSVHMSINFNSRPKEIGKTSPELPQVGRKRIYTSSLAVSKETSTPPQKIANRASVNGLLKQHLIKPPSENRRSLKSSIASGSKERSPLICSPFSFRSEERAAKRKEFFQKLEEKANFKETGQKQRQERFQERMVNDNIKDCQSRSCKVKVSQDSNQGSKSPSNHIKKIAIPRPRSPKLGRKPATSLVKDTGSLPPRRPSVTSNNSKCVIRQKYQGMTQSVTSLGKKMNGHENSSPNIQS